MKNIKYYGKCTFGALVILGCYGAFANDAVSASTKEVAENTEKEASKKYDSDVLAPFEVTAMRFADTAFDIPANVVNISSSAIDKSGLVSVPEILRRYANVNIYNTGGSPFTSEITMRGFGENGGQRVLILVDGQRMNTLDLSKINWAQIPTETIENIEVMRGPQSANYGNYAESGVVKITTKRWAQPDTASIGGFYGSYGEYNAYARVAHSTEDYYVASNLNYYHNDSYLENSKDWSKSAGLNLGAKLDSQNELTLAANGGDSFIEWALPFGSYDAMMQDPQKTIGVSSDNRIYFATISTALENRSSFGEGVIQMGMNMRDIDTLFPSAWGDTSNNVQLWTASFTPRYRVNLGDEERSFVEGGVDVYYDDMASKRYSDGNYSNKIASTDIERITIASWLGGKCAIDDMFSINASGRYEFARNIIDHTSLTAPDSYDTNKNFGGLAAQIGLNAKLDETWSIYFRFDQVYRYPAIDEMASYWGYGGDKFNPAIDPEKGQNYEVGVNFARGAWKATAALFYMHLDNEIVLNPLTYVTENIGSTDRLGADLYLAYELKSAGISTRWALVSAKFDGGQFNNKDVPMVPLATSTTRFWVRPIEQCEVALEYEWASTQYMCSDFANVAQKMDNSWTLNIVANFFITQNVRAFVSCNNLTDEKYASYAVHSAYGDSWYPSLGRTFRVGVNFSF